MKDLQLGELLKVWKDLEPRERRAVLLYASRVLQGQKLFGPVFKNKKNWAKEALEEGIDASVYLTFKALDLEDDG